MISGMDSSFVDWFLIQDDQGRFDKEDFIIWQIIIHFLELRVERYIILYPIQISERYYYHRYNFYKALFNLYFESFNF